MRGVPAHPWAQTRVPADGLAAPQRSVRRRLRPSGGDALDDRRARAGAREHGRARRWSARRAGVPARPLQRRLRPRQLALIMRLEGDHARRAGVRRARWWRSASGTGSRCSSAAGPPAGPESRPRRGPDRARRRGAEVAAWRALLAAEVWSPYWLTELAAAQTSPAAARSAYESLDEALVVAAATGAEFYSAEALRVRGELRGEVGDPARAGDLAPRSRGAAPGRVRAGARARWRPCRRAAGARDGAGEGRGPRRRDGRPDRRLGAEPRSCDVTRLRAQWRLGGKGASTRGVHGRIEEHGLHVWLGYYDNAFRLMREVYDELDRPRPTRTARSPTWRDAFVPAGRVGVEDARGDVVALGGAASARNELEPGAERRPVRPALDRHGRAARTAAAARLLGRPSRSCRSRRRPAWSSVRRPSRRAGRAVGELTRVVRQAEIAGIVGAVESLHRCAAPLPGVGVARPRAARASSNARREELDAACARRRRTPRLAARRHGDRLPARLRARRPARGRARRSRRSTTSTSASGWRRTARPRRRSTRR